MSEPEDGGGSHASDADGDNLVEIGRTMPKLDRPVAPIGSIDEDGNEVTSYMPGWGWAPQKGSLFDVRVGPDYAKKKRKAPSAEALYDCLSVDFFGFTLRPDYVADTLKLPPLSPALRQMEKKLTVPVNIIINLQFPRKITTSLFSKRNDGEGALFLIVFRMKESTARLCLADEATEDVPNSIKLLKKTFENADEDPGHNLFGCFKQIGRIVNIEEIDVPGILTPLLKFNGKPRLLRTIKFRRLGHHSVEILSGTFDCNYILRSAVINYKDAMGDFVMDLAWCLEGEGDEEQPEQVLGCFQLVRAEFKHATMFPCAGTRIDMAQDYLEHSFSPMQQQESVDEYTTIASGDDFDFKSGTEEDNEQRQRMRTEAARAANRRLNEVDHDVAGAPSDSDGSSDEYDSDGNPVTAGRRAGRPARRRQARIGAQSSGSEFNLVDQNPLLYYGDEIQLITQTAFVDAFSKKVASTPVHSPGPVGYYDKIGHHGVLAVVPPVGGRAETLFHPSQFTILRPDGSTHDGLLADTDGEAPLTEESKDNSNNSKSVPLRYGDPFILIDQNGLVWNNRVSTSIKYNYIGPRKRFARGEMTLTFAASGARQKGDVVRCGDRLCIDVVDANRTQQKYNQRLTNSKRAASSLIGGYICSCGEGRVLVFQPQVLRRRVEVRMARTHPSLFSHNDEIVGAAAAGRSDTDDIAAGDGVGAANSLRAEGSQTTASATLGENAVGQENIDPVSRSQGRGNVASATQDASQGSTPLQTMQAIERRLSSGDSDAKTAAVVAAARGSGLDVAITHDNIDMKIIVAITCIAIAASLAPLIATRGFRILPFLNRADELPTDQKQPDADDHELLSPIFYIMSVVAAVASTSYVTLKRPTSPRRVHRTSAGSIGRVKSTKGSRISKRSSSPPPSTSSASTPQVQTPRSSVGSFSAESKLRQSSRPAPSASIADPRLSINTRRHAIGREQAFTLTPARSAAILRLRAQYGLDGITSKPQPYYHLLKECHPCYLHGRTRNGVQICYIRPGTTNIERLKRHGVTVEILTQHYLFCWEYLWTVLERNRASAKCFVLLDLAGLRYVDIVGSTIKALRAIITLHASIYPNRNDGIVLFNVPWFFNSLWRSLGSAVAPKTREKILLLGQISTEPSTRSGSFIGRGNADAGNLCSDDPEIVDKLLEFIPPEHLPEAYFHNERCTGSADFGQSDEELSIRRHVESVLIETGTAPVGVDLAKYCLQELQE